MGLSGEVLKNFEFHAGFRDHPSASEFVSRMAAILIEVLDEGSAFGRRLIGWGDSAGADAVALRAIAGFHYLKLAGMAPELVAHYPPNISSDAALKAAVKEAIGAHDGFLTAYLSSPPQTNEVARSSMIVGAALMAAHEFGLPLETYEIGASAGLNLAFADYKYEFGEGHLWGRVDAPVLIRSKWSGNLPVLEAPLRVTSFSGCDQNPLDPSKPEDRLRLTSYVWADQSERMARIAAALDYASQTGAAPEKADAADWVERCFGAPATAGVTRMLYHTVVWQYLAEDVKARIAAAMAKAGAQATEETPVVWFRFENDGGEGGYMEMDKWPGGQTEQIGRADFHGRWVTWA